jgi:superfamily II DNA or RNA helicase
MSISTSNLESNINSCNINLENEYKLAISPSSSPLEYNKFLLKKEVAERKCLAQQDETEQHYTNELDNGFLYPNLNDINFNIKIAEKKEFNDTKYDGEIHQNIKEYADMLAKADFELSPHQMFVKNFLSSQTPYNSLLLYHGLGTGKTLSAIGVCEEMRDYMKQMGITKRIMIVASENVQDNFRLQLFDERKLQLVDGVWTMKGGASIGNKLLKEINPMNMKGIPKEKVVNQIKNLINTYYIFLGYGQFANYIIKTIHYDEEVKRSQMKPGDQTKIQKIGAEMGDAKITLNKRIIRKLRNEFDNRLIVIDEVHNIRKTEDNENKKVALNLELLVKAAKNMRLLLLSATPMYNSYKEIIWLLNLMNMNDRRGIIQSKDVFDKNGNFKEGGEEVLIRKATGYVSFVRGENPYTFPYRVYPNEFAKKNTFPFVEYPSYQMNLKKIKTEDKKRILGIYLNTIGNCGNCGMCQYCVYKYIIHSLRKKQFSITTKKGVTREMPSFENMESFGYTLLQTPLESLIISYPMKGLKEIVEKIPVEKYSEILDESKLTENKETNEIKEEKDKTEEFDVSNKHVEVSLSSIPSITESESEQKTKTTVGGDESPSSPSSRENNEETERTANIDPHYLTGKKGLERMMDYVDQKSPPLKGDFEYKKTALNDYGKIFSYNEIGKYSSKIKCILDKILVKNADVNGNSKVAEGVILIYSQYIDSGLIPMALALEEFGFTRYGENVKPLFKNKPTDVVDVRTMKPPTNKKDFMPARYAMITGDPRLSPNNDFEVKGLTNDDNKDGNKVKVILISKAGSEGIDFKFIRQVHILEPWYNMNRIEQIIGRGVRNFSHKDLPFEKRNVQIFMYGTILGDNKEEAADLYVFRVAELKATQTGNVTRLLKETAVDCIINHGQTNFTQETMSKYLNEEITQQLSTGLIIHDFKIGDAPFSPACDYMPTCNYVCRPTKDIDENNLNEDTYNDTFIKMNSEKINQKIRLLMKEGFFYNKETLIDLINIPKKYPLVQIYAALTMLIDDNNEFIVDKYGRNGRLVNIGEYYLFQPIELLDKNISIYERSVPIDYKHSMISFDLKPKIGKSRVDNNIGVDVDVDVDVGADIDVDVHNKKKEHEYEARKNKILAEMNENFDLTKEYLKPGMKVPRGDDNWFKHCGVVMRKLVREYPDSRDYLLHFLAAHMIELLLFEEKLDLMNYIYSLKEIQMNSLEYFIKDYFERKSITTKNFNAMILYNLNKRKIMIFNNKTKKWIDAEPEDQREIAETSEVRDLLNFKISDFNVIVGFMGYEKNNKYLIFKTKDIMSPRDTGARCDEAGKNKTMQILNKIIGEEKYTKENTKILKDEDKNVIQDAVGHIELCVMQEFVLRFFDKIRKNDKKWFLSPEMALYHKLYTIHVK